MASPSKTYIQMEGPLFEEVQKKELFEDQKTFVDATPQSEPEKILSQYESVKNKSSFNLADFIDEHFSIPVYKEPPALSTMDLDEYIHYAWSFLERNDTEIDPYSTRIRLPHHYIVPGGRFRELYYWDSFFTALGLIQNSDYYLFMDMIKNYSYLIDTYGFIPNGTRRYFLTRSQPPVFVLYMNLLKKLNGFDAIVPFINKLEKEYEFWMNNGGQLERMGAFAHRVQIKSDVVLNRYCDAETTPRPESYIHDYRLGSILLKEKSQKLYQDIRSAAESGWDFSSRWFTNGRTMDTIATTDILPIDLNCLLYFIEEKLSEWYGGQENFEKKKKYHHLAEKRKHAILTYFWSEDQKYFFDYYWNTETLSESWTVAGVFPLFVNIATQKQADHVAYHLERKFLQKGGLITTLNQTAEQWDKPNGWAPLQWIAVQGLRNYGYTKLATEIEKRFTQVAYDSFKESGSLFEKYNMLEKTKMASGGEYHNQIGFGWTNGVVMDFMDK